MKVIKYPIILLILVLCFTKVEAQQIVGDTIACNGSYKYYAFPQNDSLQYEWDVIGGSYVDSYGDSLEVIWTVNTQGTIKLTERDSTFITNVYILQVALYSKPRPLIVPDFLSSCTELKFISFDGDKEGVGVSEELSNSECYTVCDSTPLVFYAEGYAQSTFEWTVLGYFDTLFWSQDSIGIIWTEVGDGAVLLKETSLQGCEQLIGTCINIIEKPKASFEINNPFAVGNNLTICNEQQVSFINTSIIEQNSSNVIWLLEENVVGTGDVLFYNFEDPGTYELQMIVKNECNCTDTSRAIINVDSLPAVEIECPSVVCQESTQTYMINAVCDSYDFDIIGSNTYVQNGNELTVTWDAVPPSGYGQLIFNSANCPGYCTQPTVVDIPVVIQNAPILGNTVLCNDADYVNYSVPFWPGTFYEWSVISANGNVQLFNDSTHKVGLVKNNATGTILLQVIYYNELLDCGDTSQLTIDIKDRLDLTGPSVVCVGTNVSFEASPSSAANPYVWRIDNAIQAGQTTHVFNQFLNTAGSYIISVENADYCNIAGRQLLAVEILPAADTIIGADTICIDNFYFFETNPTQPDYYIEWMLIDGTDTVIDQGTSIAYKFNSSGPYQVYAYQLNVNDPSCASIPRIKQLYLVPPFPVEIAGTDTVCANATTKYTSNLSNGQDYFWTLSNPNLGSIFNATSDSIEIQWNNVPPSSVELYVSASTCGNTVFDTLLIYIEPAPSPNIMMSGDLCVGAPLVFTETNFSSGTFNWTSSESNVFTNANGNNSREAIFNTPGTHFVNLEVQNPNGCVAVVEDVLSFNLNPEPVANISVDSGEVEYCIEDLNIDIFARLVRTSQDQANYSYIWVRNGTPIPGTENQDLLIIDNALANLDTTVLGCVSFSLQVTDTLTGCTNLSNPITLCIVPCPDCGVSETVYPIVSLDSRTCNNFVFSGTSTAPQFQVGDLWWDFGDTLGFQAYPNGTVSHSYKHSGIYTVRTRVVYYPNDGIDSIYTDTISCFTDTLFQVAVPVMADFDYTFACNANNQMTVNFEDISNFVAGYTTITNTQWWIADAANNIISNGNGVSTANLPTSLTPGDYTITLCKEADFDNGSTQVLGDSCCITKSINVPKPAQAAFTFAPSPVCEGTPVHFTDQSQGDVISWEWNYGDGSSSLLQHSVRTYGSNAVGPPSKNVVLTVIDKYGCQSQNLNLVDVNPDNFHQVIAGDSLACAGDEVVLSTEIPSNLPSNPEYTTPITYQWNTGATTPTIRVTETGTYSVALQDAFGCIETADFPVQFFNAPAATITGPDYVCALANFELEGPQNVGALSYEWQHSIDQLTWTSFANQATYSGQAQQSAGSFSWLEGTHYIRLIINTAVAGVLSCPDTSITFSFDVLSPIPEPEIKVSYSCNLPATLSFINESAYTAPNYHWNTGQVNIDTIVGYFSGLYGIRLIDSFGCGTSATLDFNPSPIINSIPIGCATVCDTSLPVSVPTYVYADQHWEILQNGQSIQSGFGNQNITLLFDATTQSGDYSIITSGNYYDSFCQDTLNDFLELNVENCCEDFEAVFQINDSIYCQDDSLIIEFGNYAGVDSMWFYFNDSIVDATNSDIPFNIELRDTSAFLSTLASEAELEYGCWDIYILAHSTVNCLDTASVSFCLLDTCCIDSVWASIDFLEDTVCNNTVPLIDIDFNFNAQVGIPDLEDYTEITIEMIEYAAISCYDDAMDVEGNVLPVPIEGYSDTSIVVFIIPHNGDSLGNATCIGDTIWDTIYFEPCVGCDSLGLIPNIEYNFSNGYLNVQDESFGTYGYHLVEMWYNGQYYSGAPGSSTQFQMQNIGACDTLFYTISYFLDDICCTATCYEIIKLDCEDIDIQPDVSYYYSGDSWYFTYNGGLIPTAMSWTFPDGSQEAGTVAANPNVLYPSWTDYDAIGGEVCVILSVKVGEETDPCGSEYVKCCNIEYCFNLETQKLECDDIENEIKVVIDNYGNNTYSFSLDLGDYQYQAEAYDFYWSLGNGAFESYDHEVLYTYECSDSEDLVYENKVSFTVYYKDEYGNEYYCKVTKYFKIVIPKCGSNMEKIVVYPNPTKAMLTIDFSDIAIEGLSYTIYNTLGKVVYKQETIQQTKERVPVENWSRGVYNVVVKNEEQLKIVKFVKE